MNAGTMPKCSACGGLGYQVVEETIGGAQANVQIGCSYCDGHGYVGVDGFPMPNHAPSPSVVAEALRQGSEIQQFRDQLTRVFTDMTDLLVRKRESYGPGNLTRFGTFGIVVRASDKIERLVNMHEAGATANPDGDSMKDAFRDLIGYAALALLMIDEADAVALNQKIVDEVKEAYRGMKAENVVRAYENGSLA